jgi:hypothetical protein
VAFVLSGFFHVRLPLLGEQTACLLGGCVVCVASMSGLFVVLLQLHRHGMCHAAVVEVKSLEPPSFVGASSDALVLGWLLM